MARPSDLASAQRLLVVRLDNVGDLALLSPALRALKTGIPAASITLLASPAGSQVAPMLPWVDDVITERVSWQDASGTQPLDPGRELRLVARLSAGEFDAALIFTSFSQSPWPPAYVCALAGIPLRAGQARDFGGSLLTHVVTAAPDELHQADRNLHLIEALGLQAAGRELELHPPAEARVRARTLLHRRGVDPDAPYLVLGPGASCPARRYDLERFAVVARSLVLESGLPAVVIGAERERDELAGILAACRDLPVASVIGAVSIPELAAVISGARLVLCNDSGPMHIADAFARPQVVLYSGTELESQWRPRFSPHRLLRKHTDCSPCYAFHCRHNMECLDFTPDQVVSAALELLDERPAAEPPPPGRDVSGGLPNHA